MKIFIKQLSLVNFKGIKSQTISFNHVTNIFGENAAGKTTIFDAFTWLFFGKDSTDRKDFEIKTRDTHGKVIPMIEHEVSALLDIDGKVIEIKRILKEKWEKKRGTSSSEFTGNENLFFWNEVPLQLKQFQDKIKEILDESIFKLITNPNYFNQIKWQERRQVLMSIAGTISNTEVLDTIATIDNKDAISAITNILNNGKSLTEYRTEIAAKKKKLKDELSQIPNRIDEVNRSLPIGLDFETLRKQIQQKEAEIQQVDDAILDINKADESKNKTIRDRQNQLHELKTKEINLKNDIRSSFLNQQSTRKSKISDIQRLVDAANNNIRNTGISITNIKSAIERLKRDKQEQIEKWDRVDAEKMADFSEGEFSCPACKQSLPAGDIEAKKKTLIENFNLDKSNRLDQITEKGKSIVAEIDSLQKQLEQLELSLSTSKGQLTTLENDLHIATEEYNQIQATIETEISTQLESNKEYSELLDEIQVLENLVSTPPEDTNNTNDLRQKKSGLQSELDGLKLLLSNEEAIKRGNDRINILQKEEGEYAQQLASLEGSEFLIDQFNRAHMNMISERVNKRFKYVTFRMFDTLINGGEVECCDTLINSSLFNNDTLSGNTGLVPFADANNAAKINAGLDIINTLCEHYQVYAPIFIDNRESVNKLIDCNSQVVNLIVSTDQKLRVA